MVQSLIYQMRDGLLMASIILSHRKLEIWQITSSTNMQMIQDEMSVVDSG